MKTLAVVVILWVLALAIAGLLLWAILTPVTAQEIGCTDKPTSFDLNGDGVVSSIDQMCLTRHYGEIIEPPQTSTPETLTPTPTPNATLIDQIIADSTGSHEGCIPPPAADFDWGQHGRYGDQTRDSGDDQLTGWGVVEWRCDLTPFSGAYYEVRNIRVYAFTGSAWVLAASDLGWCVKSNVASNGDYADIPCTNGHFAMPTTGCGGQCAIHWATSRRSIPAGTICLLTTAEARGTPGLLANLGADWIDNGQVAGDHVVGRFQALSDTWRSWAVSGCTRAQLQSRPLPF